MSESNLDLEQVLIEDFQYIRDDDGHAVCGKCKLVLSNDIYYVLLHNKTEHPMESREEFNL